MVDVKISDEVILRALKLVSEKQKTFVGYLCIDIKNKLYSLVSKDYKYDRLTCEDIIPELTAYMPNEDDVEWTFRESGWFGSTRSLNGHPYGVNNGFVNTNTEASLRRIEVTNELIELYQKKVSNK
jgi:hypothetical protein